MPKVNNISAKLNEIMQKLNVPGKCVSSRCQNCSGKNADCKDCESITDLLLKPLNPYRSK